MAKGILGRFRYAAAAIAAMGAFALAAHAETLYVATLRDQGNATVEAQGGALFTVDPETAQYTLVAPLRIGGVLPVGVTGLTIHPRTGVFYGITAGSSANIPRSLVTIDPTNGNVTLVGSLGHTGSDIRFDAKGVLYAWLTDENRLATLDLGTGHATPLPQPSYPQTVGGGIAFDHAGTLYVAVSTSAGTIDTWKPGDDKVTTGPTINGAPYVSALTSLAFSDRDTLYAVNSNLGSPAKSRLLRIDRQNGRVIDVGPLPPDTDPLAFAPTRALESAAHRYDLSLPWIVGGGVALFVLGLAIGSLLARRGARRA